MFLLALLACRPDPDPDPPAIDLVERLGPTQVRAGVITDEAALFGGISAEGRSGDLKIYNDRAQFIVQGLRRGSYYLQLGGGVIDADWVRPEGMPGGDMVDEWTSMLGFGRLLRPDSIEVVSDGSDGEAVIRVTGVDVGLALLAGVFENPDITPLLGLNAVTEYRLRPGSPLLEVRTTVTATTPAPGFALGDLLMGAPELADAWTDTSGLQEPTGPRRVTGYIAHRNDGAVAILGQATPLHGNVVGDLIGGVVDAVLGFEPAADLDAGASRTFTRWYGVGPDLAALTDAAHQGPTEPLAGEVVAADGPVAGARVHVLVDEAPWTLAVSDAEGRFEAQVPAGAQARAVAEGRGRGLFFDLPAGAPPWPAFAAAPVYAEARAALAMGAPALPLAQGRGVGQGLTLGQPGTLVVQADDGLPFTVRVGPGAPDDEDRRLIRPRPDGLAAAGWSRGAPLELAVEPGTWEVLVHRGMRHELHTATVEVQAGRTATVTASLPAAYAHPGWLLADPHSHASPSGDGGVSMEDRVLVTAAAGIQLHVGSDHDRVADYRPLVEALGLGGVLRSVVADEVSSVLRGHINAYPLTPDPTLPNHGAVHWWEDIPSSTEDLVAQIRERHGEVIVQANHPMDSGVGSAAGWSPGAIRSPNFWTEDLDAMEVLNDGKHAPYFAMWLDLIARGYRITPVGVSDSHTHFQASPGINGTFVGVGTLGEATDAALLDAFRAHRTIASLGVFLDLSVPPGSTLVAPTELEVHALAPSWIQVDRIALWQDGVRVATVEGRSATFQLDAPADAVFVVTAEGDTPMSPVSTDRPWAASAPWWLDRDGDGFSPPLPPLSLP